MALRSTLSSTQSSFKFTSACKPAFSGSSSQLRARTRNSISSSRHGRRPVKCFAFQSDSSSSAALVVGNKYYREVRLDNGLSHLDVPAPEDYYALLSLDGDATPTQDDIKIAYRNLQRMVHPDIVGPCANALAVILNACYATLMDENLRMTYDFELKQYLRGIGSFDGRPVSGWMGDKAETRAVFVSETECIGCGMCTVSAPNTFYIEEEHGRARVSNQWADGQAAVQQAVESCPVDCIYFVQRSQLALLEFSMKSCKRENVSTMMRRRSGNMGSPPKCECPFDRAVVYVKARKDANVQEAAAGGFGRGTAHDKKLAASIARAWLDLPTEIRVKGWPAFYDQQKPLVSV